MVTVQFILLVVAWTHACIGLYFWLRLKPVFKRAMPFLLAFAVLLPALATTGANHAAEEVIRRASQPSWRSEYFKPFVGPPRAVVDNIMLFYFPIGYLGVIGFVFAARGIRMLAERRRGMVTLTYPDRKVRVPKGLRTRGNGAAACWGKGHINTACLPVAPDG